MKLRKHPVLIFILVMFSLHSICQKWDLKTDKEGVKVYTRSIEGSNVHEFRGEVTVKSNLSGVLALIDSVPEYTKWMKNCIESERIKKITPSSGYSYYVIKAPWPVSDRDACNYYKVSQDSVTRIITVSLIGKKDYLPEKSGRVRVPVLNGFWQLIPVAKWVTKIVYQVHCDIGGIVPAAIVNMYITDTPFFNLLNIKNIVEAPLYPKIFRKDVKELP